MPRAKKQRLKQRKDGRYACRYKDQWFYGRTQEDALKQREEYKRIEAQALYLPTTVRQYAEKWVVRAYPDVSTTTMQGLRIHLRKLLNAVGDRQFDEVRPSDIKEIYSTQYSGLSNTYIKAGRQLFCSLFDSAVADGYIVTNPARDRTAKPHKGTIGGHRAITPQERFWIENLCTDHPVHNAVMAMLYTGIRPQEMKAVKIERDFDFNSNTLTLHRFAHVNGNLYVHSDKGKTAKAVRVIPLFSPLKEVLQGKRGYLVTDKDGKMVTVTTWTNLWRTYKTALETAINDVQKCWYGRTREQKRLASEGKLPPWIDFTVVPYDLRHTFCAWCRDNGVELKTCITWMGHSDPQMILKIYDEVSADRDEKQVKKLENALIRSQNCSQEGNKGRESLVELGLAFSHAFVL